MGRILESPAEEGGYSRSSIGMGAISRESMMKQERSHLLALGIGEVFGDEGES